MAIDRNDPEIKALLEEAAAAATEALSAKNRELLSEVKALKAKAKGADIDPAEHAALQQERDELADKLKQAEKARTGEVEKLTKQLAERDSSLRQILVDQGITEHAAKAGVAAHYLDAVRAMHGPRVQVEAKEGKHVATLDGKPLAEALTEWVKSDAGRHFAAAPNNSGGGAGGGAGAGKSIPPDLSQAKSKEERIAVLGRRLAEAGAIDT